MCRKKRCFRGGPGALREDPGVQDMYTRFLSANLDFDSELQHVFWWEPDECFPSSLLNAVSRVWLGCIERYTWVAVFDENTHVFLVTVCCSPGSREDSRVLGIVVVWSTAVDIC